MTELTTPPRLVAPTPAVRDSYLAGERADCAAENRSTDSIDLAAADFAAYAEERRGTRTRWGVPSTVFWYVSGAHYLGSLVVRHELTPELAEVGGHVGYHVVTPGAVAATPPGCSPRASPNAAVSAWTGSC